MFAAAVSAAPKSTYKIELASTAWVGGTELKPGAYKVEVADGKAIIRSNQKEMVEVPVKVESSAHKHANTEVDIASQNSQPTIREIRVGGSVTTIILNAK